MQLFTNQAVDAASASFKHYGESGDREFINVYVSGDLGGGTITVEAQLPDASGWVAVSGGAITAAGMHVIDAAPFIGRLSLVGATAPTVNAWVEADSATLREFVADAVI